MLPATVFATADRYTLKTTSTHIQARRRNFECCRSMRLTAVWPHVPAERMLLKGWNWRYRPAAELRFAQQRAPKQPFDDEIGRWGVAAITEADRSFSTILLPSEY